MRGGSAEIINTRDPCAGTNDPLTLKPIFQRDIFKIHNLVGTSSCFNVLSIYKYVDGVFEAAHYVPAMPKNLLTNQLLSGETLTALVEAVLVKYPYISFRGAVANNDYLSDSGIYTWNNFQHAMNFSQLNYNEKGRRFFRYGAQLGSFTQKNYTRKEQDLQGNTFFRFDTNLVK